MDEITKKLLGKTHNPEPGEEATFRGFKNIIENYQEGFINFSDIVKIHSMLNESVDDTNEYRENNDLIRHGISYIQDTILDGIIKYNEEAIIKSIEDINQEILNKDYYTIGNKGNIIPYNYHGLLHRLISDFKEDSNTLDTKKLRYIRDEVIQALNKINYWDEDTNQQMIYRSEKLIDGLENIINLVSNKIVKLD